MYTRNYNQIIGTGLSKESPKQFTYVRNFIKLYFLTGNGKYTHVI